MIPHAEHGVGNTGGSGANRFMANPYTFVVDSPNVAYTENHIHSKYAYRTTTVVPSGHGTYVARPQETNYEFKVDRNVGKVGLMLVGWGGNNGSTVTAGVIANRNRLAWATREGTQAANYYGSVVMSSTMKLGVAAKTGEDVHVPLHSMLPMVHPNDLVIGGWDINVLNLAAAMDRAQVLEPALKDQLREQMTGMRPLASIYYPDFIAANQKDRANNVLPGTHACTAHLNQLRQDIR
jgi:myo-inositol-1-phosphate synthase